MQLCTAWPTYFPRSSDGEFHMELLKDTVPGCTLAVTSAKMDDKSFASLKEAIEQNSKSDKLKEDIFL